MITMKKPYWSVFNVGSDEEILQVKVMLDCGGAGNIDMVHRMVAQWFEEDWENCGDQVAIKLIK